MSHLWIAIWIKIKKQFSVKKHETNYPWPQVTCQLLAGMALLLKFIIAVKLMFKLQTIISKVSSRSMTRRYEYLSTIVY